MHFGTKVARASIYRENGLVVALGWGEGGKGVNGEWLSPPTNGYQEFLLGIKIFLKLDYDGGGTTQLIY